MKKYWLIFLLSVLFFSCNKERKNNQTDDYRAENTLNLVESVDTFELILDALRKKNIPADYLILDDVKNAILTYADYRMDDLDYYVFINSSGNEVVFNANDTNFELIIPKKHTETEKFLPSEVHEIRIGENIPNPRYLNKKFQVVWRTIQLNRNPQNEIEYYYQEYDEIIYLKPITP